MRVVRSKRIAGSADDRAARKVESDKAEALLLSEGGKLTAQIESLQSKLFALERSAKLSEKRLGEMDEAVVQLRIESPKYRTDEYASRLAHISQGLGAECLAAESDVTFLTSMLAIDVGNRDSVDVIRIHFRYAFRLTPFINTSSTAKHGMLSSLSCGNNLTSCDQRLLRCVSNTIRQKARSKNC